MTNPSWPGARFVLALTFFCNDVFSHPQATGVGNVTIESPLPTFGDTIQVHGGMARTDQDFRDGLALDFFSPKARTLIVQQNKVPLSPQFVAGVSGEGFVALQNYSYIIRTNDSAQDLIAKIEISYKPEALALMGIQEANTFVAQLSADNRTWMVNEESRNVHRMENKTRMIKQTSIDGEFMLLGRKSMDTSNVFLQFGHGDLRTVHLSGGIGPQTSQFIDGLGFSVVCDKPLRMNVRLKQGVNSGTLPSGTKSLNSYAWIVNTTNPQAQIRAEMRVPFNRRLLADNVPTGFSPTTMLVVAKRPLNATSGQFQTISASQQKVLELPEDRITVSGLTQLDGQYLVLIVQPVIQPPQPAAPDETQPTATATLVTNAVKEPFHDHSNNRRDYTKAHGAVVFRQIVQPNPDNDLDGEDDDDRASARWTPTSTTPESLSTQPPALTSTDQASTTRQNTISTSSPLPTSSTPPMSNTSPAPTTKPISSRPKGPLVPLPVGTAPNMISPDAGLGPTIGITGVAWGLVGGLVGLGVLFGVVGAIWAGRGNGKGWSTRWRLRRERNEKLAGIEV